MNWSIVIIYSLWLILSFLSIVNCRSDIPPHIKESVSPLPINPNRIPVIFVPGIKGSILVNYKGEVQWLTGSQALGLNTPDLRVKYEETGVPNSNPYTRVEPLHPSGPVNRVTAIPYIIDASIYDGWIRRMLGESIIDFFVFSYDWRLDNIITRAKLLNFIKNIKSKYKEKPVLVGHSMGGMLAFSVVNYNPDLVSGVVYVGVPFRGGIGFMRNLYEGVPIGLNSKIQSPCTIARYTSVYGFFPRLDTWDTKDLVLDEKGQPIPIDFFSSKDWESYSLGFYGNYCKPDEIPNPVEFARILNKAKYFRESLDPTPQLLRNPPPSIVVIGKNRETREKIQILQPKSGSGSKIRWNVSLDPKALGDGSVTESNSHPPEGFPYSKLYTEFEHSVMLNDTIVQDAVLVFLQTLRSSGEQN